MKSCNRETSAYLRLFMIKLKKVPRPTVLYRRIGRENSPGQFPCHATVQLFLIRNIARISKLKEFMISSPSLWHDFIKKLLPIILNR